MAVVGNFQKTYILVELKELIRNIEVIYKSKDSFSDPGYEQKIKTYCSSVDGTYGNFSSVKEATDACSKDNCCSGVYQEGCGEEDKSIKLCKPKPISTTTENNCVYQKVNNSPG